MQFSLEAGGILIGAILSGLGLILCIIWIVLPFIVFSIRNKVNSTAGSVDSIRESLLSVAIELAKTNQILRIQAGIPEPPPVNIGTNVDVDSDDSDGLLNFDCPACGKNMEISVAGAGLVVSCPDCSARIQVPAEGTEVTIVEAEE
jgi:DNA-directed RNA polymerase subunit RPC12/RpoP